MMLPWGYPDAGSVFVVMQDITVDLLAVPVPVINVVVAAPTGSIAVSVLPQTTQAISVVVTPV